jgi:hypothetical protein
MATFTKKELQTQINNIDNRTALLKLPTVTMEEGERIQAEKLNAARNELLEKIKVAPECSPQRRPKGHFPQKSWSDSLPRAFPRGRLWIKTIKEGPPWTPFIVTLSHKKLAQGVIAHSARNLILGFENAIQ